MIAPIPARVDQAFWVALLLLLAGMPDNPVVVPEPDDVARDKARPVSANTENRLFGAFATTDARAA
jgi:hypothetical protein